MSFIEESPLKALPGFGKLVPGCEGLYFLHGIEQISHVFHGFSLAYSANSPQVNLRNFGAHTGAITSIISSATPYHAACRDHACAGTHRAILAYVIMCLRDKHRDLDIY